VTLSSYLVPDRGSSFWNLHSFYTHPQISFVIGTEVLHKPKFSPYNDIVQGILVKKPLLKWDTSETKMESV